MAEDTKSVLQRFDRARTSEYVRKLVELLLDLQARTDPGSTDTPKGKDLVAFQALNISGKVVSELAGWAIDHQVGLAREGLAFVPLAPSGSDKHPEYVRARAAVDDHRHEYAGAALRASPNGISDPTVGRQLIINLVYANPGAFPFEIARMLITALQDLEYGRVHPLLAPRKSRRKVGQEEQQLQLSAIGFVTYGVGRGKTKAKALQEVADAYGVSRDAIRTWEKRLRKELGPLEVSRRLSYARNAASLDEAERKVARTGAKTDPDEGWPLSYGEKALQRAARSYRAVKREKNS